MNNEWMSRRKPGIKKRIMKGKKMKKNNKGNKVRCYS